MRLRAYGPIFVALVVLSPAAAMAQRLKPADRGPWEITAFGGSYDDSPEYRAETFIDPNYNLLFGAGLRYHLSQGFFLSAEGRYAGLTMRRLAGGVTDLNSISFGGLLGYTLPLHARLDLYALGGVAGVRWSVPDAGASETDLGFQYGGGIRIYLTDHIALDGDYRMLQVPNAIGDLSQSVGGQTGDETWWGSSFTAGISYFIGTRDSDHDGVVDGSDACPDTPRGVTVDARGCPVDTDRDGVADYLDRCPATPAGARVDGQGCPIDSDNDGVFDGLDRCPDTPAGATVNGQGCPIDSDNDGVFDGLDRCPDTPAGARVDGNGCPVDSDGDGVYDGLDRCPNTPAGTAVDAAGCPLPEPERVFTLSSFSGGVTFEFDSAQLTAEGRNRLRAVGDTLVMAEFLGRPITIDGHTDSRGSDEYNMALSRRRAETVRNFLRENFPQFAGTQFTVNGFGETRPVATNDTDEGRAQNRRVEIRLGGR